MGFLSPFWKYKIILIVILSIVINNIFLWYTSIYFSFIYISEIPIYSWLFWNELLKYEWFKLFHYSLKIHSLIEQPKDKKFNEHT